MEKTIVINLLGFAFFLSSCSLNSGSGERMSKDETVEVDNGYVPASEATSMPVRKYVQWIQDLGNGFRKEKRIKDLTFSVQFKPYEYIVCLEEKKQEIADNIVRKKVAELDGMQYYDLKISLPQHSGELLKYELSSAQQYQERVNYFAFGMQDDIQLIEGRDTIACTLYHFERSYDVAPASTFLLGFPTNKQEAPEEKTLLIYDRIFNTGLIKFTFRKNELKELPKLKTL